MEGWVRKLNVRFKSETGRDRKSTRLNSSHDQISYAVFCLKKKKKTQNKTRPTQRKNNNKNTPNYSNSNSTTSSRCHQTNTHATHRDRTQRAIDRHSRQ